LIELVRKIVRGWGVRRIDAIAAPAGFFPSPVKETPGGVYRVAYRRGEKISVDREIVAAAQTFPGSDCPENLGIPVAAGLARLYRTPAYAVDPVSDEISPGVAFSLRAAARQAAEEMRRPPVEVKLVVALLDREIAVAALQGGMIIDSSIFPPGDRPLSPRPANRLPREAMIRGVAREIGAAFVAAGCDVEAIVLAGELTRDQQVRREVRRRVNRLAPVVILEGPPELAALAFAAAGALAGKVRPLRYRPAKRRAK
jgi:butyrate kinase